MCDFSTWVSGLGDMLGNAAEGVGGALSGAAESAGSALGSLPSLADNFGSYLGGLLGAGDGGLGAAAQNVMDPQMLGGPIVEAGGAGSLPLPLASFESPQDMYSLFQVQDAPMAQGVGTVPLDAARTPLGFDAAFGQPAAAAAGGLADTIKSVPGFLQENYKWMLPALGIGYSALQANKPVPGEAQTAAYAQRMSQMGNQLTDPLLTGQLPAGYQVAFDRMRASAEAAIKSKYAQMGISGSSMERQELANVPQQLETQKLQLAQSLATQGMQAMGLGGAAYNQIAQNTIAQDKMLSDALARFGAAAMQIK